MELDSITTIVQRQGFSGKQLGCVNVVAQFDCFGPSNKTFTAAPETFCKLFLGRTSLASSRHFEFTVFEGGQGLIDLVSKWKAMRLQSAHKMLYNTDLKPWIMCGLAVLRATSRWDLTDKFF